MNNTTINEIGETKESLDALKLFAHAQFEKRSLESKLEFNVMIGSEQEKLSFISSTINGRVKQMLENYNLTLTTFDGIYVVNVSTGAILKYAKKEGEPVSVMYVRENENKVV